MGEELNVYHTLLPAFEERSENPVEDYGVGPVTYYVAVHGEEGAVTWDLSTGIHLNKSLEEIAGPITWHSPNEEDGTIKTEECRFFDGPCYGESAHLAGERVLEILKEEGSRGVYEKLLGTYNGVFGTYYSVDDLDVPEWTMKEDPRRFDQ